MSRPAVATGPAALLDLRIFVLVEPAIAGKAIQAAPAFTADPDAARRMVAQALD